MVVSPHHVKHVKNKDYFSSLNCASLHFKGSGTSKSCISSSSFQPFFKTRKATLSVRIIMATQLFIFWKKYMLHALIRRLTSILFRSKTFAYHFVIFRTSFVPIAVYILCTMIYYTTLSYQKYRVFHLKSGNFKWL